MNRTRSVALVTGIALASGGISWAAATRITDPDEARRETKAPKASLVTVPIERRELSANLVLRASLSFDEATTISIPAASGADGSAAATRVVTKDPAEPGSEVVEGQSLVELSGRPLIALQGALPVFRDLIPGSTGADVEQLEEALARLGHNPGTVDATFDAGTQSAIDALYVAAGYQPREPTRTESERIEEARTALTQAQTSARAAAKALADSSSPRASTKIEQQNAVDAARRELDAAKVAASRARANAPTLVAEARAALDAAVATSNAANAQLAAATVADAVDPETGDPYTTEAIAGLRATAAEATAEVTAKFRGVGDAQTSSADAITAADNEVVAAEGSLRLALATAQEQLSTGNAAEKAAADDAQRAVTEATTRLAEAEAATDGLPQSEVVFVRSLPRRVGEVFLRRGDVASGELMTVSGSSLALRTSVTAADRTLVKTGTAVTLTENDLDLKFDGVVTSVADQPRGSDSGNGDGGNGGDGSSGIPGLGGAPSGGGDSSSGQDRFEVLITPGELPQTVDLPTLEGLSFRVTIPVKSTDGAVLAVPAAALSATGDDQIQVEVLEQGSETKTRFVPVQKGLAAQGLVEVSALEGESLEEGDEVVVGR